MEKKLYRASLKGDVETLEAMMREDELILARLSISSCSNQTPLHLASLLGHFEFAKSLLSYKPDFASRLDSQGRSPLHLASANGYSKMVKLLLEQDPNISRVPDEDGRTPLHLAVMNGQYESVSELIKFNHSEVDQEKTILHLCVMYNRLNILILILESIDDKDFSHIKDENGNNILHSATALKRVQIIKYMVSKSEVEVNGVNGNGLTALDMIEQLPKDVKTMEIKELLISAGAVGAKQINAGLPILGVSRVADDKIEETAATAEATAAHSNNKLVKIWKKVKKISMFQEKKEKRDKTLLVAASVIAAMAYQAAISPPGGIADMDAKLVQPGTSLLAHFDPDTSRFFWISNTISFVASLSVIFLFVSGASLRRKFYIWLLRAAMWITVSAMAQAYAHAVVAVTNETESLITYIAQIWVGMICLSALVVIYHFLNYTIKPIIKKRTTRGITGEEITSELITFQTPNTTIV